MSRETLRTAPTRRSLSCSLAPLPNRQDRKAAAIKRTPCLAVSWRAGSGALHCWSTDPFAEPGATPPTWFLCCGVLRDRLPPACRADPAAPRAIFIALVAAANPLIQAAACRALLNPTHQPRGRCTSCRADAIRVRPSSDSACSEPSPFRHVTPAVQDLVEGADIFAKNPVQRTRPQGVEPMNNVPILS